MHSSRSNADDRFTALTGDLLKIWSRAHGGEKAHARILEGQENLIAIVIDHAFTAFEIRLEEKITTRSLIREYAERLIELIKPEMIQCVEDTIGCIVAGCWIEPNVRDGNLLFLFKLDVEKP